MNIPGYGETVVCPYNKAHVLLRSRFQTHLVKCARNYPDMKLEKCPFDVTHHLRPEEKAAHMESCPSRASFDQYRFNVVEHSAEQKPIEMELPPPKPVKRDNDEESWDDVHVASYDPQRYVQNAPILRTLNLARPSERNRFRDEERRRIASLRQHPTTSRK